jgi:hypothetical protein
MDGRDHGQTARPSTGEQEQNHSKVDERRQYRLRRDFAFPEQALLDD